MVGKAFILVRGKNGMRYRITTSKRFSRCDKVWIYFRGDHTIADVELQSEASPDIPHVEVEETDHFHIDLGIVDSGE